jgi:hypothetical protein
MKSIDQADGALFLSVRTISDEGQEVVYELSVVVSNVPPDVSLCKIVRQNQNNENQSFFYTSNREHDRYKVVERVEKGDEYWWKVELTSCPPVHQDTIPDSRTS